MSAPDIDLPKLAGAAGSAVGLIISAAVLLSWVTARYTPASDQYRQLTRELRGWADRNRRHAALVEQIAEYRTRLRLMTRASALLCWVMVFTILTVLSAGTAIVYPGAWPLGLIGGAFLFVALVLEVGAVGWMLAEIRTDRRTIEAEATDIAEVNGDGPG